MSDGPVYVYSILAHFRIRLRFHSLDTLDLVLDSLNSSHRGIMSSLDRPTTISALFKVDIVDAAKRRCGNGQ